LTTLVEGNGRTVALGVLLGSGGEGQVHAVADTTRVAKILLPKSRRTETHDKIAQMMARPPPGANDRVGGYPVLAWPQSLLYADRPGRNRFVGYTMPRVDVQRDFVPLYQILSAARRKSLGGAALTFDHLVLLGLRITHVVRTLHAMNYAVGDLNDRNILISRRLTPLFLDTDSFEVPRGILGHYPSRVGDRLYWPPELLGEDLATYKPSRVPGDRYALAVILFQLFLNGMRPYQSRGSLAEPYDTLEAKTLAGMFAWASPKRGVLEPPAGAPDYQALPRRLRKLFELAFVDGHMRPRRRPRADQWYDCLKRINDGGFEPCRRDASHRYPASEARCPWCRDPNDPFGSRKIPMGNPFARRPAPWRAD
jgi:DNA-binding helix-hairpin-helix protein with protein kinase domain